MDPEIESIAILATIILAITMLIMGIDGCATAPPNVPQNSARDAELQKLKAADYADRANSVSWSTGNPELDQYYTHKAEQVEDVMNRLKAGQKVAPAEVERALNTENARQY